MSILNLDPIMVVSQTVNVEIPIHFHLTDLNGPGHSAPGMTITSHILEFILD